MSPSKFIGSLIASFALVLALLASPGCGSNKSSNPGFTDEKLIQDAIDAWLSYLERGEQPGPVDLYEPAAWNSSPAKTEWTGFAGKHPTASDVAISVSGSTASATFTVTTDDQEQTHVTWALHKVSGTWLISSETWT